MTTLEKYLGKAVSQFEMGKFGIVKNNFENVKGGSLC